MHRRSNADGVGRRAAGLKSGLLAVTALLLSAACSLATVRSTATAPLTGEQIAELWVEPESVPARDLFWGPGGPERMPSAGANYRATDYDSSGHSPGYSVVDGDGRRWRVKIGDEAQSELVASRLLWGIGYHQPAMYLLRNWTIAGARPEHQGTLARFRLRDGYRSGNEWSWQQNPFVGTREFNGLIVAQLILNNWDFKTSNNRVYSVMDERAWPRTWFVVQDLGASLGATRWPFGDRNNIRSFEQQTLIDHSRLPRLVFDYHGRHRELLRDITPTDVVWTCGWLARLTDRQWRDVFRAASYDDAVAARFIMKLRAKIQEGLALTSLTGNNQS